MFFFSFLFFITLYVLSCFLLCIWIGHFPMHSTRSWLREIILWILWTRNRWKWHLFYKGGRKSLEHVHCSSKTSMDSSSRRPQVMAENQKIRLENEKARLLSIWSSDDFFLSISLFSSNVDKLWTFFVCLKNRARSYVSYVSARPGC